MFLLNGNRLPEGTSFYDANGVQYGSGWLNQATEEQKAAIGITWVADPTAPIAAGIKTSGPRDGCRKFLIIHIGLKYLNIIFQPFLLHSK